MKTIHLKQKWKGVFTYQDGYSISEQYNEVEFTMEINLTGSNFIGTSIDSESKIVFNEPATVKGFMDSEKISFIMKYPCAYYKDQNGKVVLDRNAKHPEIHYLGFFDEDKTNVNGNWEMTIYEEKNFDDFLLEILNGEFRMTRLT